MKNTFILLSGLLVAPNALSQTDPDRTFTFAGKSIEVTAEHLQIIRQRIDAKDVQIMIQKPMTGKDARWILDYISFSEGMYSPSCKKLKLMETRHFDVEQDTDETKNITEAGQFDFIWKVQACENVHKYRVVNGKDMPSFLVYPIEL
ncbi:hypothetical protein [Aliiglaciecola sp. LCG003]|uniref:hypothetical protein n=1 Tax=Aliiglaciecola sp. LCG003 TaxID=3053655 RepID=UPI002573EFB1|nr:hypothetical protein [Aliiglaciecola sp. LCG003]WJG10195.1 hypothetical protein QR722_03950 [Aliiglaciecola sp. LCG003]